MSDPGYIIGDHTADLELRVYGRNLLELFINAARGMLDYTAPNRSSGSQFHQKIDLTACDLEELLVSWLNELLYLLESKEMRAESFTIIHLSEKKMQAILQGKNLLPSDERGPEIKAATYHQLLIEKTEAGWECRVILDL